MRGGARVNSGPVPDPNALRRDRPMDRVTWRTLPAEGRIGAVPDWPLSRPTRRELALWARQWVKPQAIAWEESGQLEEVALYVRALVVAERPRASVAARTLVRQLQESLGLSLPGLLRLRWRIGDAPTNVIRPTGTEGVDVKARFRVVSGGSR